MSHVASDAAVPQPANVTASDVEAIVVRLKGALHVFKHGARRTEPQVGVDGARRRHVAGGEARQDGRCKGGARCPLSPPTAQMRELVGRSQRSLDERYAHQVGNPLDDRPGLRAPARSQVTLAAREGGEERDVHRREAVVCARVVVRAERVGERRALHVAADEAAREPV